MKFTQLKQDIKECARPIYLIEGDDAYFRSKAEEQIKTAYLSMPELNFTEYEGSAFKGASLSEITSAMSAYPFMSEKRIVKLYEFYPTESDYDKYLKQTFENPPESAILLIVNSQSKKGVDLKRKKCITYVDCNRTDRETVAKWVYLTMKREGIASSVEACETVADYCLCDMARVSRETQKLIEWGKDVGKISVADVDALVYEDADYKIYQMTGAVARRNMTEFTQICYDLLLKGLDENAVIFSLLKYFKNLLLVITSDLPDGALASQLNMSDYVLGKTRQQARAIGQDKLIVYINELFSLASSIKNGLITVDGALEGVFARIFFG